MVLIPTVVSSIMFIKKKRLMLAVPPSWRNLWTEWELRGLILLSLTTQIILVILGNRRKYIAGTWIRFIVWSTYLLADSIALMAAGIISKDLRDVHNACGLVDAKYELKTFWAPLLLLHLGGTDTITAYSLEDNELWKRHLLGVVIQAIATVYIWVTACTSSRLSLLFILMFLVGLVKYCERVWVLYWASEKTFRDSIPDVPTNDSTIMEKCKLKLYEGYHLTTYQVFEVEMPHHLAGTTLNGSFPHADDLLIKAYSLLEMVKRLFADLILGFQDRYASREIFKRLSSKQAFKVIEIELGFIYDLLYTKANAIYSPWGIARRIVGILIILTVLVLFVTLKEGHHHSRIDFIITLVLLVVALLLELYAFRELLLSDQTAYWLIKHKKPTFLKVIHSTLRPKYKRRSWSNSISQFSLLSFSLGKAPLPYYGILKMLRIVERLKIQPHHIPQQDVDDTKNLIFWGIKDVRDWAEVNNYDTDLKALYGRRGGCTLERYNREDLAWTVEKGFDQSILIWHLATEICFFQDYIKCNYLSRYMLYLLVRHPNMLPIGMGNIKFRDIYKDVGHFIEEHAGKSVGDEVEASKTLRTVKTDIMLTVGGRDRSRRDRSNNVIFYACKLASALGEGEEKWKIIKDVWLEMLGHAASQCKGRLHAQQLRRGGELLTHVWLLMAHFGLTDHFQISRSHAIAEVILR
ncbi:hypothetical protein ACJW30_07G035000 [Castanea mollissima]